MRYLSWERLKFYLLIVLIMISIIQVGILWTYQDYGFPISFFGGKSNADSNSNEKAVKNLLDPFRVIVSEGSGDLEKNEPSQWILTNNKDRDYVKFWEDAKTYLIESVNAGQKPVISDVKDWSTLALSEKSIIFDFKTKINQSLLLWLFDIKKDSENIPVSISKIIISPWQNTGVLYISDEINTYSYSLNLNEETLKSYDDLFNKYSDSENNEMRKYTFIKDINGAKNFDGDVLVIVKGGQYMGIKNVDCTVPESIRTEKAYSENQVDEIAGALLGAEKDGYDRNINRGDNSIEFKTQNKIYKISSNGNLEYKFITDVQEADKGDLQSALVNSYKLISGIKSLVSDEGSLYLSKVTENARGSYTLNYDYIVEGIPVAFSRVKKSENGEDEIKTDSAVTIEVNRKGILNCTAKIRKFAQSKAEVLYNVNFVDLQTELRKKYKELKTNENIIVKEAGIFYNIDDSATSVKPVWVFSTIDKNYILPMHAK